MVVGNLDFSKAMEEEEASNVLLKELNEGID